MNLRTPAAVTAALIGTGYTVSKCSVFIGLHRIGPKRRGRRSYTVFELLDPTGTPVASARLLRELVETIEAKGLLATNK